MAMVNKDVQYKVIRGQKNCTTFNDLEQPRFQGPAIL